MPGPALDITVDASDFSKLVGKTSQLDRKIRAGLRRELRTAAEVAAAAVREEVRKPPLHSAEHPVDRQLRESIAAGVRVQLRAGGGSHTVGVLIKSTGGDLTGSRRKLARLYDRPGGWMHPVFRPGTRVHQVGRPYFGDVIRKYKPAIEARVRHVLTEAKRSITN